MNVVVFSLCIRKVTSKLLVMSVYSFLSDDVILMFVKMFYSQIYITVTKDKGKNGEQSRPK